ncbi:MAG: CarD family transcriptional regulator [Deltaproteobacteria bacterium RBG_16_64_85]|nr:MAG: CarD family transcriptional regulator [Deltaproteobacteria bacterium RBG_16_64_85]
MSFKVGDMAVYPAHGVGIIQAIETKSISGGRRESFYVLRILDTGITIMVPVNNTNQVGLRRIMDSRAVTSVYKILRAREMDVEPKPWNRRYRQYMDKLKSGSPFEIAEVLRNLLLLKGEKALSFGERKMLDTARSLLVKEISLAKAVTEEAVEEDLRRFLNL